MPFATVEVTKPGNRLIYINGNYVEAAGNSSNDTFTAPPGGYVFETLTSDRLVDYRKSFRVKRTDDRVTVELDRIDPPEAVEA